MTEISYPTEEEIDAMYQEYIRTKTKDSITKELPF